MRKFVDVRHVVFWSEGGATKPSNLVALCRFHHRRVHEGGYRLDLGRSGQLRVWNPEGEELPTAYPALKHSGPCRAESRLHEHLTIDSDTLSYGYNDPLDYDTSVEYLHKLRNPPEGK